MKIKATTGVLAQAFDQQTFGAAVVSKTLDYMHNTSSPKLMPVDEDSFGAQVVDKTLDYLNSDKNNQCDTSYSFQKDVLQGHLAGALLNKII